jgi:hypothetical protein
MRRYWLLPVVIPAGILLTSCSSSPEGPFVGHCQNITAKLAGGGNVSWTSTSESKSAGKELRVDLAYSAGGSEGTSSCHYTYLEAEDDLEDGEFDTAPYKVMLNDQEVSTTDLLRATKDAAIKSVKESAENLDDMAIEAAEKAKEVAGDAAGKARELAHDAAGKVKDAAGNIQNSLDN